MKLYIFSISGWITQPFHHSEHYFPRGQDKNLLSILTKGCYIVSHIHTQECNTHATSIAKTYTWYHTKDNIFWNGSYHSGLNTRQIFIHQHKMLRQNIDKNQTNIPEKLALMYTQRRFARGLNALEQSYWGACWWDSDDKI